MSTVSDVRAALELLVARGASEEELLAAIEPLRERRSERMLHEQLEKLIRAGHAERAVKVLEARALLDGGAASVGKSPLLWFGLVVVVVSVPLFWFFDPFSVFGKRSRLVGVDAACAAAVESGFQNLQRQLDVQFPVTGKEVARLEQGEAVRKGYSQGPNRVTVGFRVEQSGGGCDLVAYEWEESYPGGAETSYGDFGRAPLPGCRCE